MSLKNEIQKLLKKSKVDFVALESDEFEDLYDLFRRIVPDRCLNYDAECVDDIQHYSGILEDHANITGGEFSPSGVQVSGDAQDVVVEFTHENKTHRLKIALAGSDYVDPSFYTELNAFCKKALPGSFVMLPTRDQSIACVYLPKKLVKTIEKKYLRASSTDALAEYLINGGDVYQIVWHEVPFNIRNGFTREGESIATAIVKNSAPPVNSYTPSNAEVALETLREEGNVNVRLQNKVGQTPYRLASEKAAAHPELHKILEEKADSISFDEFAEIVEENSGLTATLVAVFNAAQEYLQDMFFNKNHYGSHLQFSPNKDFILGEDTFALLCFSDGFDLHVQTPGEKGGAIVGEFQPDELEKIVGLIRKYCSGELWN